MVWAHGLRGAGRGAAPRGATRIFREGNRTRTKIDGHLERKHGCFAGRVAAPRRGARRGYSESSATPQVNALGAFAANELSALYLDVAKDRLYVSSRDAGRRVACQSVLVACLDVLPKLMAPVLPHLAEELYQSLPHVPGTGMTAERGSVFGGAPWKRGALADFPAHDEAAWAARRALRDDANAAIEKLRRDKVVGASLDAAVGSPERSSMSLDPTRMPRPSRACRRLQKSSETDFEVRSRARRSTRRRRRTPRPRPRSTSRSPASPRPRPSRPTGASATRWTTRGSSSSSRTSTRRRGNRPSSAPRGSRRCPVETLATFVAQVKIVADADAVAAACAPDHVVASVDSATGATVGAAAAVAPRCARCWYPRSARPSLLGRRSKATDDRED